MREEVYGWMKQFAVYYIFLTAVMNVLPDEKYIRFIRYFTGLLLILLAASPVFEILQIDGRVSGQFWEELLNSGDERQTFGAELQTDYLRRAYQEELKRQITERLKRRQTAAEITVELSEDGRLHRIIVTTEEALTEQGKEAVFDELEEVCGDGIGRKNVCFSVEEVREGTVDGAAFGGHSSGGDRDACGEERQRQDAGTEFRSELFRSAGEGVG